jgi:multidrug efflux pump subunit AcrB
MATRLGIAGRIAAFFQTARITPLLALLALLLGGFAVIVTPREEEPQINVTMVNVLIPFPGAAVRDVEQMVAGPAEQVLGQIAGIEHVMSVSRPGLAVITVQFKVGVPRTEALVRLYDAVNANADWLPKGLGVGDPLIKPKGIDDVPIVTLTLFARDDKSGAHELERVAHSVEADLKRVPGTREVTTVGGPGRAVLIEIDPARLSGSGITVADLRNALQSANLGLPVGDLLAGNRAVALEAGPFLRDARDVGELVVGVHAGRPVFLQEVANVHDGALPAQRYVWHGVAGPDGGEFPAVSIAVTKKPGENAIDVANAVMRRVDGLRNTLIPHGVEVAQTRNYGATANDKAQKLIQKLLFATACVVALVFIALGRREAAIVGAAVILTLTVTLFASWAWGFTLNRVSLFAVIFSIGILVDDAIVVVENIHRHQALHPDKDLVQLIPGAVDEVGGPTILATLTVIAALLPMAFVSGLMGPYMSPIPINASMGMLLSLAIAFVVTPWLARLWMKHPPGAHRAAAPKGLAATLGPRFERIFGPLLDERRGARNRALLGAGVAALIAVSLALPVLGGVVLKMLPFDNKSEFQVVVDMPAGTPVEQTAAALRELGAYLARQPEVTDYQAYAGTAAPINFNGLVRQYYLRAGGEVGDLQVNLVDKHARAEQSHAIATRLRPGLQKIAQRFGANLNVVEVPPGPPVLSPIVAEVYGPEAEGRRAVAKAVRAVFESTPGIVDVDDSSIASAPRKLLLVDRRKAAMLGVPQQADEVDQQDRIAHDDAGQRDHADHAGGGELRAQQRMARHHPDDGQGDRRHDDQRREVRAELRHHQQVDEDQADRIGGTHVAEGLVGDLPLAVPLDGVVAPGVVRLADEVLTQRAAARRLDGVQAPARAEHFSATPCARWRSDAVVRSAATRAQPILLTGMAAMLGAFFILDDPIFNGLAISLIFGILVSTVLTLVVIPLLYFVACRRQPVSASPSFSTAQGTHA